VGYVNQANNMYLFPGCVHAFQK